MLFRPRRVIPLCATGRARTTDPVNKCANAGRGARPAGARQRRSASRTCPCLSDADLDKAFPDARRLRIGSFAAFAIDNSATSNSVGRIKACLANGQAIACSGPGFDSCNDPAVTGGVFHGAKRRVPNHGRGQLHDSPGRPGAHHRRVGPRTWRRGRRRRQRPVHRQRLQVLKARRRSFVPSRSVRRQVPGAAAGRHAGDVHGGRSGRRGGARRAPGSEHGPRREPPLRHHARCRDGDAAGFAGRRTAAAARSVPRAPGVSRPSAGPAARACLPRGAAPRPRSRRCTA